MRWALAILLAQAAAPRGGSYTLPPLTATTLGGVKGTGSALVCSGTDKATGFNASGVLQCGADQTSAGGGYATVADEASSLTQRTTLNFTGANVSCVDNAGATRTDCAISGAPATSGSVILLGNGAGAFANYAGATSCTNQFFTGLSSVGASTCTTATLASAQFANQGTTTTLLHGNAAGNPSFAAVADADITPAYSGTGACAAGTFASTLTRNAAPTCTSDNWHFLGTATGAATTVGPIVWTAAVRQIQCWYQIKGYNGGTPVGRFLIGTASISTTGLTNSYAISEGVTAPTTASGATATPGIPLAVTLSAVGRAGTITVDGASGSVKVINVLGQNQTPAVATVPTIFQGASFFSDLGTNLAITRAQLTVYDTLTATSVSAQAFLTGTYLACWGRNTN